MTDYAEFGPEGKGVFPVQKDVTIIGSGLAIRIHEDGSLDVSAGKHCGLEDYVGNRVVSVNSAQAARLRALLISETETPTDD